MLSAQNVSFSYGEKEVLKSISLELNRGEVVGVIGPNGAGKSTLIKVLSGILQPQQGKVTLNDTPLKTLSASEIARWIAVVPQTTAIIFPYRVLEVVLMGRYVHSAGSLLDRPQDVAIARDALTKTEALEFADSYFNELSGGEQQLVIIARALAQQTPILLLDEPTSALDLKHQALLARLLTQLAKSENKAILITSHNINFLSAFCQRLIILKAGQIITAGEPQKIINSELMSKIYDTPVTVLYDSQLPPLVILSIK